MGSPALNFIFQSSPVRGGSGIAGAVDVVQSTLSGDIFGGALRAGQRIVFENISWQSPNSFQILLTQSQIATSQQTLATARALSANITTTGTTTATAPLTNDYKESGKGIVEQTALNAIVQSFHLRSFSIPHPQIEYETINYKRRVKNIIYPENITFTFIEDEWGTVRKFIEGWLKLIVDKQTTGQFVFRENQLAQEKTATIFLKDGFGKDSINYRGGWFIIDGLKYNSCSDITVDHGAKEFMGIELTCTMNNIWFYNPNKKSY